MIQLKSIQRTRKTRRAAHSRLALVFDALETRTLMSADPGRLSIHMNTGPRPTSTIGSIIAADGAALKSTNIFGVIEAVGTPASIAKLSADLAHNLDVVSFALEQSISISATPNDPSYLSGAQADMNAISAPSAWDVTTGSAKVVVAGIDTGIDYTAPDLYQNIWINQAEIPPSRMKNLVDVDADGLISFRDLNSPINQGAGKITDLTGHGHIDASDILQPMVKDANGNDTGGGGWVDGVAWDGDTAHPNDLIGWNFVTNTNDPMDDEGHGTHTAGTIGATGNNGVGVAGVDWTVSLMALKFISASGQGTDLAAAQAIQYSALHGARVSNNSYAGSDPSTDIETAIQHAQSLGDIVVAAAGNSSSNNDAPSSPSLANYPSSFPEDNIIAVAALDQNNNLAAFSNYGKTTVDIAAPGVNIVSTYPGAGYTTMSGTSMATPHVTGVVALLFAKHPNWTYTQIINQIYNSADPNSSLTGKVSTGGSLDAGKALAPADGNDANYVISDTTSKGNWTTLYGADGNDISQLPAALPAYATVTLANTTNNTWTTSTTDSRALLKSNVGTGRIAADWSSTSSESFDIHLSDGANHQVALYGLDWDTANTRSERIDVIDDATGTIIDTRTLSSFHNGTYLVWNLKGNVTFNVTNTGPAGSSAVVSGLFFAPTAALGATTPPLPPPPPPPPPPPVASASYVQTDVTTSGSWKSVYGADGSDIQSDKSVTTSALPSYATVSLSGTSTYTWAASTTDPRALQKAAVGSTDRVAGVWYAGTSESFDIHLSDGRVHQIAAYALDWDYNNGRAERIDVIDDATHQVLDSRSIATFQNGAYLVWNVKGSVTLKVTNTGTGKNNAVLSGLFFSTPNVTFSQIDTTTQGNWKSLYGSDGWNIEADKSANNPHIPSYATLTTTGTSTYPWASTSTDPRALQKSAVGSTDRVAGVWYAANTESFDLHLNDGYSHQIAVYALDWDYNNARAERFDIIDDVTGKIVDTRTISSFSSGEYLVWNVKGNVTIKVTNTAGTAGNAVVSAFFIGKGV